MFGFRPDGRRLKSVDPIVRITPYLMPMRCDAQVFLQHNLDYEKMSRYIVNKGREGQKITFMQIIAAAYVRSVSRHPEVNRFIFNKQYYARKNCSMAYVTLKDPQNHDSSETTVKINFDLTDTIFDVRDRMDRAVEEARNAKEDDFLIKLASTVLKLPGVVTVLVALVKLLDRYGLLPGVLVRELPFYVGLFVTNNGSIGLPAPLQLGITADERVCSGAHYAAFFADVMHYIANPEELETPPEEVKFDENVEYHVEKVKKPD